MEQRQTDFRLAEGRKGCGVLPLRASCVFLERLIKLLSRLPGVVLLSGHGWAEPDGTMLWFPPPPLQEMAETLH